MASSRLVSKLNFETKPHPRTYKLQWLSKDGEFIVNKQVEVCLSMGHVDLFRQVYKVKSNIDL